LRFLGGLLCRLARNPVLMILEDAHWIDPVTGEFIDHLLKRITDAPILIVITHRPEFRSVWTRHPQVTALTRGLDPLLQGSGRTIRTAGAAPSIGRHELASCLDPHAG
jgi:predicted ATPase